MISLQDDKVKCEQISFFLGRNTLLTFQEIRGDIWDLVRDRIDREGSALRTHDVSFRPMRCSTPSSTIAFPSWSNWATAWNRWKRNSSSGPPRHLPPDPEAQTRNSRPAPGSRPNARADLQSAAVRRQQYLGDFSLFLRDVHDHSVQVIELLETYRDLAAGLSETYLNAINFRLTQVMKVLTIISTVFMPLSFLAGVYGMNFKWMPEIENPAAYPWSYPIGFWGLVLATVATMLFVFKRNRWL